jgi:hypothetical protein
MKLINILKPILLFCLVFSVQIQAQVQIPSQELVEELLQKIENCKGFMAQSERYIQVMEKNASYYTLAEYNKGKEYIEGCKACLNESRRKLDSLREGYSGWFNSPNATMPLGRGHDITPRGLENKVVTIEERFAALFERFGALEEPED